MTPLGRLESFAAQAHARVRDGYYDLKRLPEFCPPRKPPSMRARFERDFGLIAEVKPASPTLGDLRTDADAGALARAFAQAGAAGISALVPREHFGGSPENVIEATTGGLPVLFKDFIVHDDQIRCARRCGASVILLILDLHEHGAATGSVDAFVQRAHDLQLEVLLEVYDEPGYGHALRTRADMIGINNRDLRAPDLGIDLERAPRVIASTRGDRPTLALSGCERREDVEYMREGGASGVLVGSALMKASDPARKLRELIGNA